MSVEQGRPFPGLSSSQTEHLSPVFCLSVAVLAELLPTLPQMMQLRISLLLLLGKKWHENIAVFLEA